MERCGDVSTLFHTIVTLVTASGNPKRSKAGTCWRWVLRYPATTILVYMRYSIYMFSYLTGALYTFTIITVTNLMINTITVVTFARITRRHILVSFSWNISSQMSFFLLYTCQD